MTWLASPLGEWGQQQQQAAARRAAQLSTSLSRPLSLSLSHARTRLLPTPSPLFSAVERDRVLPLLSQQCPGDVLLGLSSSGVHSNGFSLVRRICAAYGVDMQAPPPYPSSAPRLVDDLLTPTRIYIKALLPALRLPGPPKVKALAHITGGGLPDNVPRGIAPGLVSRIDACSWPMPPVFKWLASVGAGVEAKEMARTFNCGIGMVVVVGREHVAEVKAALEAASGEAVHTLGQLESAGQEGGPLVILDNLDKAFL